MSQTAKKYVKEINPLNPGTPENMFVCTEHTSTYIHVLYIQHSSNAYLINLIYPFDWIVKFTDRSLGSLLDFNI